jgi:hypothetical protein
MSNAIKLPTEVIDLPSKGLVYPSDNLLSSGQIEMKYMTAKEEDILTNSSYIQRGIVLDELMKSLIVSKVNYDDLIAGDKNAVMVAARILGYGKDYTFNYGGEEYTIDLTSIENKPIDEKDFTKGINEFSFTLPHSKVEVTYKLLTNFDENKVQAELDGLKKINKNLVPEMSTRLKYIVTSINGNRDDRYIREFVDNSFLARDSKALRDHIKNTQPDIDLTFFPTNSENRVGIPIGINFFYPES